MIHIIAAMSDNGVIGRDNRLPWHLPNDLKRFRALTTGHTIVMGRRTYESIGRPLPDRRSIVLTRDASFSAPGVETAGSLEQAIAMAGGAEELFVIGGEAVYRAALPLAQVMHLTLVHATIEGDVMFPPFDRRQWVERLRQNHPADERHAWAYSFVDLERVVTSNASEKG